MIRCGVWWRSRVDLREWGTRNSGRSILGACTLPGNPTVSAPRPLIRGMHVPQELGVTLTCSDSFGQMIDVLPRQPSAHVLHGLKFQGTLTRNIHEGSRQTPQTSSLAGLPAVADPSESSGLNANSGRQGGCRRRTPY
jgi:hypothetical protein